MKMKLVGVDIVLFFLLKYGFFNQKLNFRNYWKIVIIDGKIGFVGGLNVGKEYISRDLYIGFWRDIYLWLEGEIV